MKTVLMIDDQRLSFRDAADFIFNRKEFNSIEIDPTCKKRINAGNARLHELLDRKVPIYGVTTGFGDSCFRVIEKNQSEELQKNLISYLLCGTGADLPESVSKGILFLRLKSLCRGYSGVSLELLERMKLFLENNWIPRIPCEGSLGASGDLIPLAYIAQAIQGEGMLHDGNGYRPTAEALKKAGLKSYRLKPKEGLALVNGTSAMAGLFLANLNSARALLEMACVSTSWLCLSLKGRTEAFGVIVNEKAKAYVGQGRVARCVRKLLDEEGYSPKPIDQVGIKSSQTEEMIQDRYSLRCVPQILGPVEDTLVQLENWLELEMNGTSDNPLIDEDGSLAMGGNFYGGYLSQGMDYLKISLAHTADLIDRQLMTLIDEKSNRGLPPNLADWPSIPQEQRFLHHGLKGLHQAVSAITSEILARSLPNGIFSRSSESHNQDKVSLGMSAAVQCAQMIESLFTIQAMYFVCLAQALDLRKVQLSGEVSKFYYNLIRERVSFVSRDTALESNIRSLTLELKKLTTERGGLLTL